MTAFVLNRPEVERHKTFGLNIRRGIYYASNNGIVIRNRELPDDVKTNIHNRVRDMIRYQARVQHLTAYEQKVSSVSDAQSQGAFLGLMQSRGSGHAPESFSSQSDKCSDEFMARFNAFEEFAIDLMIQYGANPVHKAKEEGHKLAMKDGEVLASLGSSHEAGLTRRNFIFSNRPWTDLPVVVAQFWRARNNQSDGNQDEKKQPLVESKSTTNPFDDRNFVSESETTRELKSRTMPMAPTRRGTEPEVYLHLFSHTNPSEHEAIPVPFRDSMTVAELKSYVKPKPKLAKDDIFALLGAKGGPVRDESQTLKKLGIVPGQELRVWHVPSHFSKRWSIEKMRKGGGGGGQPAKRGRPRTIKATKTTKTGYDRNHA